MGNSTGLNLYKVGGCVRDHIRGIEPRDIDYVVLGESPASMIKRGFKQVGESFPVFLHPESGEEYALARNEISTGEGYGDFSFSWEGVTLEEDLFRRDLTINAMAIDADNNVVDPYGGQQDIEDGVLRHVSSAFREDPLRILRVARFAAQLGYSVAPETRDLMATMVSEGMLSALPGERVWVETEKAFGADKPSVYFEVLDDVGALKVLFPEVKALEGVPQRPDYHAEGDVWIHTRMVMDEAAIATKGLNDKRRARILCAALCHDLGKANTPKELQWGENGDLIGRHHGHEDPDRFAAELDRLAQRIKMPSSVRKFCYLVAEQHQRIHAVRRLSARKLIDLYEAMGLDRALRHDAHFLSDIVLACASDNFGRRHMAANGAISQPSSYPQGDYLVKAMAAVASVNPGEIIKKTLDEGYSLDHSKQALHQVRMARVKGFLRDQSVELGPKDR